MADVGQIEVSGEQSRAVCCYFKFDLMSYMDASVNIMFHGLNTMIDQPMEHNIHGLINPCIQIIESHQLYNNHYVSMTNIVVLIPLYFYFSLLYRPFSLR
jgi:hypothetical protein